MYIDSKMKGAITIMLCFLVYAGQAQDSLYTIAQDKFKQAEFESALKLYEQASALYRENDDQGQYASCNLGMAECHLSLGEPKNSLILSQSTKRFVLEVIPDNVPIKARSYMVLGNAYLNTGRNDLAIENLELASDLFEKGTLEAAICYEDLGIAYWNNGNRELALQFHEMALEIRKEKAQNQLVIGDSYINIGLVYLEEEPRQSIIFFNRALDIYKKILSGKHPKLAYAYSDLAFANAHLGNYNDALSYLDQVEGIWDASLQGDHPNKAYTLSNRGRILEMKGDHEGALVNQQEALKMYLRIFGDKHPDVANTYFLIGSVYQKKSEFLIAAENYQESIYANLMDQKSTSVYDIPEVKDYYNADILLSSLQAKAKALEAQHFQRTLKLRDIDGAIASYQLCDELISQIRQLRHNESDKLRLGTIASEVYDNGINLSLYLSDRSWKKKEYQELAFNFCERSKSAILLEAINETNAKSFGGIPQDEIFLEDSLKNEISYFKLELARASTSDQENRIKNALFQYQTAYRGFIERMEKEYPEYYKLKYDSRLARPADIQSKLSGDQAVLSYFIGNEMVYVFVISNKDMKVTSFDKAEDFEKQIKGFRNAILYQLDDEYRASARKLHSELMPVLKPEIRKVVVIPDGILGTIPFETLRSKQNRQGVERMMIEDYRVSYDYSATLLIDRMEMKSVSSTKGILLTAPLSFSKNEIKLNDLPQTENEVKEIRFTFMGGGSPAELVLGEAATESLLKSDKISEYKYLHFATHGMVNQSQPELSRIFLHPDDKEDGSLFAGEIYNIKINADLVTLSACETGLGKIAKGEGVVGLSRALMYAGAENIIVSLWPVADDSTAELMIQFYKYHLIHSDNNIFSDDLRKAKMSLIKSEKNSAPYYWAPFILVGL